MTCICGGPYICHSPTLPKSVITLHCIFSSSSLTFQLPTQVCSYNDCLVLRCVCIEMATVYWPLEAAVLPHTTPLAVSQHVPHTLVTATGTSIVTARNTASCNVVSFPDFQFSCCIVPSPTSAVSGIHF
jgi:hypothetical protein